MERIGNCGVFSPKCSKHVIFLLQGLGIVMEEMTERFGKLERIDDFKERVESGQNRTVASMNSQ